MAFRTEMPQTYEKLGTSSDGAAKTKRNLPLLAALENIVKKTATRGKTKAPSTEETFSATPRTHPAQEPNQLR